MSKPRAMAAPASRVLGARAFAAMTAVEGLKLGPDSSARLSRMEAQKLPHDERRKAVLDAYRSRQRPRA